MDTRSRIKQARQRNALAPNYACGVCLGHSPLSDGHDAGCPTGVAAANREDLLLFATLLDQELDAIPF
jgi:hypothetical protein